MEQWLRIYLDGIAKFPALDDSWFKDAIRRQRAGDEAARDEIICASVALACQVARVMHHPRCPLDLHDLIEEANAAIGPALTEYAGSDCAGFQRFLEAAVRRHLAQFTT
jgi:hypothetical protein